MLRTAATALLLASLCCPALAGPPPLDAQARAMLDPIRDEALRPRELIDRLHLPRTATVADIGAGPGFLTIPLARAVPSGTVIATDIHREHLDVLAARAKAAGVTNVRLRVVAPSESGLQPHSVDVVVLCQVDQYLKDRVAYLVALIAALRPNGRIVLVNYERFREPDLTAARQVGLRVVDQWSPSPPFFMIVLQVWPRATHGPEPALNRLEAPGRCAPCVAGSFRR